MTQSKETKSTPKTAKKSQKIQKNSKNSSKNSEKEVLLDKTYKFEDDNFYKVFMEQNSLTVERPIYDIIYANIIMLFAIFLSWLVPVLSFGLPILFFIYFEVGISGFAYKVENNENYKFEDLFVSLKKYIKVFCVFVIKICLLSSCPRNCCHASIFLHGHNFVSKRQIGCARRAVTFQRDDKGLQVEHLFV